MKLASRIDAVFKGKTEDRKPAELAIQSAQLTVLDKLGSKSLRVAATRQAVGSGAKAIDQRIAEQRLKEATRMKAELSRKLEAVDQSLNKLSEEPLVLTPKKTYFVDPEVQEKARELTRELRKEQKLRHKRLREELAKREVKLRALDEAQTRKAKAEETKKEQARKLRVEKMHELSLERKKRLNELQWDIKKGPSTTPLYTIKEEEFKRKVLMPELQARKERLRQIRENLLKPIDFAEIKEHALQQQELAEEKAKLRREKYRTRSLEEPLPPSQKAKELFERERQAILEREQALKRRAELLKKREDYVKLTKQVYFPRVDPNKRKQLETTIEKLKHPAPKRVVSMSPARSVSSFKPMKSVDRRETLSIQLTEPDYLTERRDFRNTLETDLIRTGSRLSSYSEPVTDRIKKFGNRTLKTLVHYDLQAIEAERQVNDSLIASVKAKLSLLK